MQPYVHVPPNTLMHPDACKNEYTYTYINTHVHAHTHGEGVIKHDTIYDTHSLGPSNVTESFPSDAVTCVFKDKYKTVL